MICSPCKNCPKKNLLKDKCMRGCKLIKEIQEMDLAIYKWDEGCGIDYTEVYTFNIPPSLTAETY